MITSRKRAFTLIELLVVIAIIAILAAILFPVFVQAKIAAKGAASISNAKQVVTAIMIYEADFDDKPPLVSTPDADAPFLLLGNPYKPWAYNLLPYMRNGMILQDPLTSPEDVPAGFDPVALWLYRTQIGYAYTIHAPVTGIWVRSSTSQTRLENPAETVLLAQKKARKNGADWLWVGGPIWMANLVGPPVCSTFFTIAIIAPRSVCPPTSVGAAGWGTGAEAYAGQTYEEGATTGGVALRKTQKSIVSWADGHVSVIPPAALASGTNWTRTTPYNSVVITDIKQYKWDSE
jgi:prepilin-type N-terminal cleavage/methylation domain-containing protein